MLYELISLLKWVLIEKHGARWSLEEANRSFKDSRGSVGKGRDSIRNQYRHRDTRYLDN